MTIFDTIKKFFSKEAPYNWGASIEHLKRYVTDHNIIYAQQLQDMSKEFGTRTQALIEKYSSLSDKVEDNAEGYRAYYYILENRIAKLEKKAKKPKSKVKK